MSYFINNNHDSVRPGPMNENPAYGISERACIQVKKVLDAGSRRVPMKNYPIHVKVHHKDKPLTCLGIVCKGEPVISDLVIERLPDRPNFARVSSNINIPVSITYTDGKGEVCSGNGAIEISNDVIMFVPQPSVVPCSVEAFAAISNAVCTWAEGDLFNFTGCVTLIEKVVAPVDILVPTYGFYNPPEAREYSEHICNNVTDLPLFPTADR